MEGKKTGLTNPDDPNDVKTFTYDHSYWSFDGCRERKDGYVEKDPSHPNAAKYADQVRLVSRTATWRRTPATRTQPSTPGM
jgi:hypothetical protein